ncbi:hypothetical protein [Cognatilysobacter bugurensis]|uniref:Beta-barrel assembly machine subunit BamC n=1 Tax=Cognatilysobacter bugurensis TaxID=543356 RepID=A0A918SX35_9GAMM|nr:hypothetical protein [Lysobacter bugurensis]GHA74559.1 hypothetical protein GCM10007067_09480 [Lysobacter bugurensis]
MSTTSSVPRIAAALILGGLVATSGCSWFRKGDALFANDPANRPLEVPPPLEQPRADANVASVGAVAPARSAAVPTNSVGFTVPGSRDAVFDRVGEELAKVPGVVIVSRAQVLGAYDVTYEGASFLVRIAGSETGSTVSAVDPRGVPVTGEAATRLLAQLKATLGGN